MKYILISLLLIVSGFGLFAEEYPPQGWNSNFLDALERAQEDDTYLLLNFTGSDWCIWCKELDKQVFGTPEFRDWAEENTQLVFVDFPSGISLSENQQEQNYILQSFFGVQGYPSIWLIDNDLTPLLVTGFQNGGAENYIEHLENDRVDASESDLEDFRVKLQLVIDQYLTELEL